MFLGDNTRTYPDLGIEIQGCNVMCFSLFFWSIQSRFVGIRFYTASTFVPKGVGRQVAEGLKRLSGGVLVEELSKGRGK